MRHLQIYRAVDAVARHGSIRRAAETLAISPSALNRQVLALEAELGTALFERLARGVRLSTAGEIYLRSFRLHISELERAASQIADLAGLRSGVVRVGVGEELASFFLPKIVAAHRGAHPEVDVKVTLVRFDDAARALSDFEIDIAIAANVELNEAVDTIHAETSRLVCVASDAANLTEPMRLSSLTDWALIAPTAASGLRNVIDAAFAANRAPRRYACEMDRIGADVLRGDAGVAQLALEIEADEASIRREGLRRAFVSGRGFDTATIRLLRARGRALPVAAAKIAEQLAMAIARAATGAA